MVKAECLPAEIWLEIFSYLHPLDNIRAFYNLNRLFNRFASTKYFGVQYAVLRDECLPNSLKSFTERLPLELIHTLSTRTNTPDRLFRFLLRNADELINLRKISIYLPRKPFVQPDDKLIDALEKLPSLRAVEIGWSKSFETFQRMKNLLEIIFNERLALRYCRLNFSFEICDLRQAQWFGTSTIQQLILVGISWSNLLLLLNQTPNLIALDARLITCPFEPSTLILSSLEKVVLGVTDAPFALLTEIRRLAPGLNYFSVSGSILINDENYFREDLWKNLLDSIRYYRISFHNYTYILDENQIARMEKMQVLLRQSSLIQFEMKLVCKLLRFSFQSL